MKKSVSIIMPCYNAGRWVGEALSSCLEQTHLPSEIIVIDDGSTDDSKRVVLEIAGKAKVPVKLIESSHRNGSAARNEGLAAATGDYVQFLDADDLMSSRKIELQLAVAAQGEAIPCGQWLWLKPSRGKWETEFPDRHMGSDGDFLHEWLMGKSYVVHCFLWPRKVVLDLGCFDPTLTVWQDGDLHLRALLKGHSFRFVPDTPVYYRAGHAAATVSLGRTQDSIESRIRVLDKVEAGLKSRGDFLKYQLILAENYYQLARAFALDQPDKAQRCFDRFTQVSPDGRVPGSLANHFATRLLGLIRKERLSKKLHAIGSFSASREAAAHSEKLAW